MKHNTTQLKRLGYIDGRLGRDRRIADNADYNIGYATGIKIYSINKGLPNELNNWIKHPLPTGSY